MLTLSPARQLENYTNHVVRRTRVRLDLCPTPGDRLNPKLKSRCAMSWQFPTSPNFAHVSTVYARTFRLSSRRQPGPVEDLVAHIQQKSFCSAHSLPELTRCSSRATHGEPYLSQSLCCSSRRLYWGAPYGLQGLPRYTFYLRCPLRFALHQLSAKGHRCPFR